MFFKGKNRQPTVPVMDRQESLACVPVKNPQAAEQQNNEGILLEYPVHIRPIFKRLSTMITGKEVHAVTRKLQLDSMGTAVWRLVDGKKSVAELAEQFRKSHQLDAREAEISVSSFLKELGKRGLIALRPGKTRP